MTIRIDAMTNYSHVDCSIRDIKPYEHPDIWWSPTFLCWTFCGQTALDHPYASSNQIAERLRLQPNPRAVQKLWIGWFRTVGNRYEYARLVTAVDIAHAYASEVFQLEMQESPVTSVKPFRLPPAMKEDDALYHAERLLDLQLNSKEWSKQQRERYLQDLRLACYRGFCGEDSARLLDDIFGAHDQSRA